MILFIRADAILRIGTGHIMRCIALAQAWQDQGGKVVFISHCESDKLRQRITDEGFEFVPIEKPNPDSSDLQQTLQVLKNRDSEGLTWIVTDGYHFDSNYQKAIRDAGFRLLIIDDMHHLPYYHADIILNQNIHASALKYACDKDTVLLLGCSYALLRREFLKYKDWQRTIPEKAARILVTMGGADPDNVTLKVIRALNQISVPESEVKIVVGPSNPHIKSLEKVLAYSHFSYRLLSNVNDMSELMAWADFSVSAAGSTCWELAIMGLPSLIITTADNQRGIGESLEQKGAVKHLGWFEDLSCDSLANELRNCIDSRELRKNLSHQIREVVDGKFGHRITETINNQSERNLLVYQQSTKGVIKSVESKHILVDDNPELY